MTKTQLERFRTRLQKEHDTVAAEIRAHVNGSEPSADEVESAIVHSDENLLEKIDLALSSIDDGTYGTCVRCKSSIPVERLEAKPAVSLCTRCQEEKEQLGGS